MSPEPKIASGAITADKITANSISASKIIIEPYFNVTEDDEGFLISFYDYDNHVEIMNWMARRGFELVGQTTFWDTQFRTTDKGLAMMAKLTFGGVV